MNISKPLYIFEVISIVIPITIFEYISFPLLIMVTMNKPLPQIINLWLFWIGGFLGVKSLWMMNRVFKGEYLSKEKKIFILIFGFLGVIANVMITHITLVPYALEELPILIICYMPTFIFIHWLIICQEVNKTRNHVPHEKVTYLDEINKNIHVALIGKNLLLASIFLCIIATVAGNFF